jgi:molybdopterin-containing oxidoreductase family molybdopterin binding subunit
MKGLSHVQRIYDPNRLKYPMKRVGERGSGEWERITWDEAIGTITSKWKDLQKEYGNSSVTFVPGSGSMGFIAKYLPNRLQNLMGATMVNFCYDNAIFYGTPNALGIGEYYNANEIADLLNAKTIIIWGANPTEAQPQNMHFILEAQRAGATVIVIDPHYTGTASKADIHVPIRPGTDGALAMAMANIIIEENLIDEDFMKRSSVAPFLVKSSDGKYLRQSDLTGNLPEESEDDPLVVWNNQMNTHGLVTEVTDPALHGTYTINGIQVTTAYDLLIERIAPYTLEYVSELCEVSVEMIKEITHVYAKQTPSTIYHGFGPDHYVNGHYSIFAATSLAILTGNLGKPGASAGYPMPLGFYFNKTALQKPEGINPGPTIPDLRIPDIVESGEYAGNPLFLKSLFIYCANPLGNATERQTLLETYKKMELIVVSDMTMTDTSRFADIVLPVAHWFEVDELHGTISQTPYLNLQEKAIEPLYESKSDWDIICLLAKGMGFGDYFNMSVEDVLKTSLDFDYARELGITYDRIKEEKVLRDVPEKTYIHGEGGVFPTATGRAQFYLENPKPQMDYGQQIDFEKERLPYWEPPHEAWSENPLFDKYPLVYGQERPKWRVHTQWGYVPWLKELDPEPTVKLSPDDAKTRNIKTGDMVKVYNDRGHVVLKAVINKGTRPGMIVVPKGWQLDQFVDGHYQDLTSRISHNACINHSFYDALVEVEKV